MALLPDRGIQILVGILAGCFLTLLLVACGDQADDALSVGDTFRVDSIEYKLSEVEQKPADALSMQPMPRNGTTERLPDRARTGFRFLVVTVDGRDTSGRAFESSLLDPESLAVEIDGARYGPMISTAYLNVENLTLGSLSAQFEVPESADRAELVWDPAAEASDPVTFALW